MISKTKNENDSKQLRQLLHDFEFSMSIYELYEPFLSSFLPKTKMYSTSSMPLITTQCTKNEVFY